MKKVLFSVICLLIGFSVVGCSVKYSEDVQKVRESMALKVQEHKFDNATCYTYDNHISCIKN